MARHFVKSSVQSISMGAADALRPPANASFSVSVWFKSTSTSRCILFSSYNNVNDYIQMDLSNPFYGGPTGCVTFDARDHSASSSGPSSTSVWNDGNWHNAVGVHIDGGTDTIYVDGAQDGQNGGGFHFDMTTDTQSWFIGSDSTGGNELNGDLAEVAIWHRALVLNEIKALKYFTPAYFLQSLKGYWPLYGVDSPEQDRSGSNFPGTLNNAPTLSNHPPIVTYSKKFWGGIPPDDANLSVFQRRSNFLALFPG